MPAKNCEQSGELNNRVGVYLPKLFAKNTSVSYLMPVEEPEIGNVQAIQQGQELSKD